MDLYQVREHYIDTFYCKNHSRKNADDVLKYIVSSSKIDRIIRESSMMKVVPTYEDFLSTVCSMLRFMFKPNDTIALATINAALRWDIEVNARLHLVSLQELKQDILKVLAKLGIFGELSMNDINTMLITSYDMEPDDSMPKILPKLKTWSLCAFAKEFGKMKVEEYVNSDTGEPFHSCVFTNGYTRTFVNFSSKLGELTKEEISKEEDNLVVVQLPSGKYKLARKGKGY